MTKQVELPHFKYIPNAYELGLFSKEIFTCDICKTEQNFRYTGPIYLENEKSNGTFKITESEHKICAYCIENGKAADLLNADFKDVDILDQACYNKEQIDEETCDAVIKTWLYQTPNFKGLVTELWPICCSNFTAFTGYLGTGEIAAQNLDLDENKSPSEITADLEGETVNSLFQKLDEALEIEAKRLRENGFKVENGKKLAELLKTKENKAVGYLFKCLECDKYRVYIDFIQKS
jgi:uncharacterized protein CbrC (UPF0167 family)